jgi:hypothetical protein
MNEKLSAAEYLRHVVPVMRELGIVSYRGIVLGPEPPKAVQLAAKLEQEPDRPELRQELAEELQRQKVARARDEMRLTLGATGRDYTDEQIDALIGPIAS